MTLNVRVEDKLRGSALATGQKLYNNKWKNAIRILIL